VKIDAACAPPTIDLVQNVKTGRSVTTAEKRDRQNLVMNVTAARDTATQKTVMRA